MILNAGICNAEELWGKKTEFSRMMLQKIGTEIIRKQVSENFWVQKMAEKIAETFMDSPNENILILLDEADLGYHPEWKKRFVNSIVKSLPLFFNFSIIQSKIQRIFFFQ